ncbi:MAG: DUF86 domain-containing protein [Verrucomicrobia bacterium]|nr:DUF86 domain-containing protein [Verrucomicrobiota bacterium]
MDRHIRDSKLESLRRCVSRIVEKRPASPEELEGDYDLQDILSLNLERAVQICVDLAASMIADLDVPAPQTMAEAFEILAQNKLLSERTANRMKKAVGFRNIAVYRYQEIDWQIVFNIAHQRVADFEAFARDVVGATEQG